MQSNASSESGYDYTAFLKFKCDAMNSIRGTLDPGEYDCPLCLNRGFFAEIKTVDGLDYLVSTDCKCKNRRRAIRRLKKSGLQDVVKDRRFENFVTDSTLQQRMKTAALDYSEQGKGWFFIGGQCGCGKSHICTAIFREWLLSDVDAVYLSWIQFADSMKSLLYRDVDAYSSRMDEIKHADALYLDDLFKVGNITGGNARPSAADLTLAFKILDFRYQHPEMPTVISTEYNIDDIQRVIDPALAGRIAERCGAMFTVSISHNPEYDYRFHSVTTI